MVSLNESDWKDKVDYKKRISLLSFDWGQLSKQKHGLNLNQDFSHAVIFVSLVSRCRRYKLNYESKISKDLTSIFEQIKSRS